MRKYVEPVRALFGIALDRDAALDAEVDQVAVREADVGLERDVGTEPLAQARDVAGHRGLDAQHGAAVQVAQPARLDAHAALVAQPRFGVAQHEAVRTEAIVFDEERRPAVEPPEELHDRTTALAAPGRLEDHARAPHVARVTS